MNLKWIGAALIIASCAFVGFSISADYRQEERQLQQLAAAMDFMVCELRCRLSPLPELCRIVGNESKGTIGKLLWELGAYLDDQKAPDAKGCLELASDASKQLSPRTVQAVGLLGSSLGRFDLEGQLEGLESVRIYCRSQLEIMATGRQARLRSHQTLGICAGAALAILFV
jgi:stage III sporulation protein AB